MNEVFDDVDVARLRRRRTGKWTLYGPDVLAAWVAEMDFDAAPVVRAALLQAIEREDFGYVEGDLTELTTACAEVSAVLRGSSAPRARGRPRPARDRERPSGPGSRPRRIGAPSGRRRRAPVQP